MTGASDVEPSSDLALAVSDREQPAAYPAGEARDDDQNAALFDETERAHEKQLLMFLADSGVGPSPAAAERSLEALNMLAINLDGQDRFRGSQILFIHAIRVRRKLLGPRHVDTAATYNNLANLLRKPAMNALGRNLLRDRSGSRVLSERHLNTHTLLRGALPPSAGHPRGKFRRQLTSARCYMLQPRRLAAALEPKLPQHVDEAEKLLNRGLQIRRDVFGDEHSRDGRLLPPAGHAHVLPPRRAGGGRAPVPTRPPTASQVLLAHERSRRVRRSSTWPTCTSPKAKRCVPRSCMSSAWRSARRSSAAITSTRSRRLRNLPRCTKAWEGRRSASVFNDALMTGSGAMAQPTMRRCSRRRHVSLNRTRPTGFQSALAHSGTKGYFMRHIMQQSGAERVSLRFATAETLTRATSSTAALGQPQSTQTAHGSEAAAAAAAATGGGGTEAASTAEDASGCDAASCGCSPAIDCPMQQHKQPCGE